ncbi:hypothetical protein HNP46_000079 [Pseudomonas nitritireducens]|uniref:HEAT repeat domain-containing protein n=1 Tax=Pseudomonas nitroreducens TaxID=46680 RepID=A0A7W7KFG5_PSENT|nr:hypothetical protein [Pseudomonas nitritireducens]MBB4861268.1 hypothetical protein [Pseudomonas nitritireducens]
MDGLEVLQQYLDAPEGQREGPKEALLAEMAMHGATGRILAEMAFQGHWSALSAIAADPLVEAHLKDHIPEVLLGAYRKDTVTSLLEAVPALAQEPLLTKLLEAILDLRSIPTFLQVLECGARLSPAYAKKIYTNCMLNPTADNKTLLRVLVARGLIDWRAMLGFSERADETDLLTKWAMIQSPALMVIIRHLTTKERRLELVQAKMRENHVPLARLMAKEFELDDGWDITSPA